MTYLIVSSKICASRSCNMFAWRKNNSRLNKSKFKSFTGFFLFYLLILYLGLAVGSDLLKRSFLELLHHLTPPLPLLLLQTGGI